MDVVYANGSKKKLSTIMPLIIALVVAAELTLLFRLDMAKNAAIVGSWTGSFYQSLTDDVRIQSSDFKRGLEMESCETWLEREDSFVYSRDFDKQPVLVSGAEEEWRNCSVGCRFGSGSHPDAMFFGGRPGGLNVLRSMESSKYYPENDVAVARGRGYQIVMTTSLSSDVPVGYFSWAEYDMMAPLIPKTDNAIAAAFISNCGARNFRLQALEALENAGIKIDSFGSCHHNHDGNVDKVETLKRYKFSLAFENSIEEDYVTEKFFQSLVAGAVPVVIGAPNINDFSPSEGSLLHISKLEDVPSVAAAMKHLTRDPHAFNYSLRWKYEGPSDSFKALVDMAAVHSSCRLCIHLATQIREEEEKRRSGWVRPCKCVTAGGRDIVHHVYVRERGRFEMVSIFLRNLTAAAMEEEVVKKFSSENYIPTWEEERPRRLRMRGGGLRVYRIYPLGLTQRRALYGFRFGNDSEFQNHVENNPCSKFEVIFV